MLITFLLLLGVIYLITYVVIGFLFALAMYFFIVGVRAIVAEMCETEHSISTLE